MVQLLALGIGLALLRLGYALICAWSVRSDWIGWCALILAIVVIIFGVHCLSLVSSFVSAPSLSTLTSIGITPHWQSVVWCGFLNI